ncbi:MAG: GTPase ObgE [Armatimonadetes bacterium]|nr:GTPase ObgE [Armatimonadota bacterium]
MFVDEVEFEVLAGRGGNGAASFRREKFVPKGGPDGGNGGRGGNVVLVGTSSLSTLLDFRYRNRIKADDGGNGEGSHRQGKRGKDILLKAPLGTMVFDDETGRRIGDLIEEGQKIIIGRGGRGGRGNASFATSTRQTPKFAEKGAPGEKRRIRLELKLMADVGVIGMPNAGKSSLISKVSAAKPKIGDYPFTTLAPNLGVVRYGDFSFVMADMPGLIEGAHEGVGLGHRFLRHAQRARVLLHLLDASFLSGRDPLDDFKTIQQELAQFDPELLSRPMIVGLNKIDVAQELDKLSELEQTIQQQGFETVRLSALTGEGTEPLVARLAELVSNLPPPVFEPEEEIVDADEPPWTVETVNGEYLLSGRSVERMVQMTDLDNPEGLQMLHRKLKSTGALQALKEAGAKDGDTVRVGEIELEYVTDLRRRKKER